MNYITVFKNNLLDQKELASKNTIKNYVADVSHFINWYQTYYHINFEPSRVRSSDWIIFFGYKKQSLSASSLKRHLASVKKFYNCLIEEHIVDINPFDIDSVSKSNFSQNPNRLDLFKNYLIDERSSDLTIKNYIIDIQQFLKFVCLNHNFSNYTLDNSNTQYSLVLTSYRDMLLKDNHFSLTSIKRKLSSVRKYLFWFSQFNSVKNSYSSESEIIKKQEIIKYQFLNSENAFKDHYLSLDQDLNYKHLHQYNYSKFPPLRLFQKILYSVNFILDFLFINQSIVLFDKLEYLLWEFKGKPVFSNSLLLTKPNSKKTTLIANVITQIIKPLVSLREFSITFINTLRHNRPQWYNNYHKNKITNYFHYGTLIIVIASFGYILLQLFFGFNSKETVLSSSTTSPPRLLSFQGKLTDQYGNPISGKEPLRFGIYSNPVGTGSALLWQELDNATADKEGNVSLVLGHRNELSSDLFVKNNNLWLGVSVGSSKELIPREQIATVGYAANADTLQGLSPITQPNAGSKNVILALDSSGNLNLGSDSTTFQATSGDFKLTANTLVLSTNPGSSGNILLSPDGLGKIDLQKPLQNTSGNNNIPGIQNAVEVDSSFAVLATSSAQSAITINQDSIGALLTASTSGIPKFTIQNDGSLVTAGNITIGNHLMSNLIPDSNAINIGSSSAQWNIIYAKQIYQNGTPIKQLFQENNQFLAPLSNNNDFGIGLNSSTSAKFSVLAKSGDILTQGNLNLIGTSSAIGTENQQMLTIGNPSTGSVALTPNNSNGLYVNGYGSVSIGKIDLLNQSALEIEKNSIGQALITANQIGLGDIFSASASGLTRFTISNNGDTEIIGGSLCINISNSKCSGNKPGTIYAVNTSLQSADLAENYNSSQQLEPGDVVIIDSDANNESIIKSFKPYQKETIGVISTQPAITLNSNAKIDTKHPYIYPIALSGRIPVKVSMENGPILTGDLLTSSSVPGVAMKALKAGIIIGKALEDFNSNTTGKIMVFINVSWADPTIYLTNKGNLYIRPDLSVNPANSNQSYSLTDSLGNVVTSIASFSEVLIGNIKAGLIDSKNILTDNISAAEAYIKTGKFDTAAINGKLISPVAEISRIHSNLISPLSNTSDISLKLNDSQISIYSDNNATSAAVTTLDNQGNASFSGTVRSSNLNINSDATISGVLRAGKIIADEIVGLDKPATVSSQYITNVINNTIYSASPSGNSTNSGNSISQSSSSAMQLGDSTSNIKESNFVDIASYSGELLYTPHLDTAITTFQQGLMSSGPTSLSDTSITGQLSIGSQLIIADNSINVLGGDFSIQPLKQGGVSIAGRQIYIDSDGNITINGEANFNGTLAANIIAPIPQHNLIVQLNDNNIDQNTSHKSEFKIKNASSSAVFTVNQLGDIIASGAATINKLNLLNPEPVLAVSEDEILAIGSAGVATISAHRKELTIDNILVSDKSLIYITPVGKSGNQNPYLLRQLPNKSFSVGIEQSTDSDTPFNWLIIN